MNVLFQIVPTSVHLLHLLHCLLYLTNHRSMNEDGSKPLGPPVFGCPTNTCVLLLKAQSTLPNFSNNVPFELLRIDFSVERESDPRVMCGEEASEMLTGFLVPEITCVNTLQRKGKILRDPDGGLRDRVRVKLDTWVPKFYDHWGIARYWVFICIIMIGTALAALCCCDEDYLHECTY